MATQAEPSPTRPARPAGGDRRRALQRRRLLTALVAGSLLLLVATAAARDGGGFVEELRGHRTAQGDGQDGGGRTAPQLPDGGRVIFPEKRVVGFYGAPQDEALGALGIGTPAEAARRLAKQARPYERGGRPVLPAFELIATIASSTEGEDGQYRTRLGRGVVREYLEEARKVGALLIIDIQPGRSDFMTEAKVYEKFLREPDVSLALDPEWHIGESEVPGQTIGSVTAEEVNEVGAYLSDIVQAGDLPQKLLVVHQFTEGMIENRERLVDHAGIALTLNVDGFGTQAQKLSKYDEFTGGDSSSRASAREAGVAEPEGAPGSALEGPPASKRPPGAVEPAPQPRSEESGGDSGDGGKPSAQVHHGFKLFYEEDTDLLSPKDVLELRPQPELVVYE